MKKARLISVIATFAKTLIARKEAKTGKFGKRKKLN